MKQRITYIDNLKALSIFTVVVGHIFWFSWGQYSDNVWSRLISAYNMPMFFFLSGMFAKDGMSLKQLGGKAGQLLVPTAVVGGLYAFLNDGAREFLYGSMHLGYWFLPTLFVMFVLFYVRCLLVRGLRTLFNLSNSLTVAFDLLYVAGVSLGVRQAGSHIPGDIYNLFCLGGLLPNMIFFWSGFLLWRNRGRLSPLLRKYGDLVYAVSFLYFIAAFYYVYYSGFDTSGLSRRTVMAFFTIPVLLMFFRRTSFGSGRLQSVMSYVGSHTLEIYVIHYFFLPARFQFAESIRVGG